MQVDKRNGNVNYNDAEHVYWNDEGHKFISVTTLIGKFEQPYDKDFWSKYKALERLIGVEKFAALEKQRLLKTKKWDDSVLELYDIDTVKFNSTQQDILDEWDKTNRESCERGTKIHSIMENKFYTGAKSYSLKQYGLGGKFECKPQYTPLDLERAVYPEYLVYRESPDGYIKLAGQIDLLVKDGNDIYIIDYKTNKELKMKSGYDTNLRKNVMMKYPLSNIMDCNFMHYTLQLSTYAWMLEKNNPEFNIKKLVLVYFDHQGNVSTHEVQYLKNDVERMLAEYRKMLKQEEREAKRKKIEF
jgi:hypothetical protein